ncbi:MAG: hypothetical protein ACLTCN_07305 [Streptococcus salivarius]
MKYLVEKYTLPRQEEATFLAKAEEQKARVVKTLKTDDYSIFITINKVVGYEGENAYIETKGNLDNVEVFRAPFTLKSLTIKEMLGLSLDIIPDDVVKLEPLEQLLFQDRIAELEAELTTHQEDIAGYRQDLLEGLAPALSEASELEAFIEASKSSEEKADHNQGKIKELNGRLEELKKEYEDNLLYIEDESEREELNDTYQASKLAYEDEIKALTEPDKGVLEDTKVSGRIVEAVRKVSQNYESVYKLLADVSELKQLLAYELDEPYLQEELSSLEFATLLNEATEKAKVQAQEEMVEPDSEETDEETSQEVPEMNDPDDNWDDEETEQVDNVEGHSESGSKALANFYEAIGQEYDEDDGKDDTEDVQDEKDIELEEMTEETPKQEEQVFSLDDLKDSEKAESSDTEEEKPSKKTKGKKAKKEKKAKKDKKDKDKEKEGLTFKSSIYIGALVVTAGVIASAFIYYNNNSKTKQIESQALKTYQKLPQKGEEDKGMSKKTYNELVKDLSEWYPNLTENKTTGVTGFFNYKKKTYIVKQFARDKGVLETYTVDGKQVDFNEKEINSIIESGKG